jgi:alpha-tubulin suppressor-like RCC1 family protein
MPTHKGGGTRTYSNSTGRLVTSSLAALALWLVYIAATSHAVAFGTGTKAVGWGENLQGQLGTFWKSNEEPRPVGVQGLSNIEGIAMGVSYSLMLLDNGTVRAAGANNHGQVGDGAWTDTWERGLPNTTVSESGGALSGVKEVAAGGAHAVALLENGTVKTWGTNENGNLGNGTSGFELVAKEEQRRPKTVKPLQEETPLTVLKVAGGAGSDFALMSDHTLRAWGGDQNGELGINLEGCRHLGESACKSFTCEGEVVELCNPQPRPVIVEGGSELKNVVEVVAGGEASYARLENGTVRAWGSNLKGQLGTGGTTHNSRLTLPSPVKLASGAEMDKVKALAAGFNHALAIREISETEDEVVGWGSDEKGALGKWPAEPEECSQNPCYLKAVPIPGLPSGKVEAIAAGNGFSLVLIAHKVWAVGSNEHGELGSGVVNGPEDCRTAAEVTEGAPSKYCDRTPATVEMPGNVRAIAAQNWHALALLSSGAEVPAPELTFTPEKGALSFAWPNTAPSNAKIDFRRYESPEYEEELSGTGAPESNKPYNTVRPHVSPQNKPQVGATLQATEKTGVWIGSPAPTLAVQWQRCSSAAGCVNISGATATTYTVAAADVKDTIRIAVTGTNESGSTTVHSPQTEEVKPEGSTEKTFSETVKVKGKTSVTINKFEGSPLSSTVPYEAKVNLLAGPIRTTVVKPLP